MPATAHLLPKYRHYRPKDLAVVRIDGHDVYLGKFGSLESHEKYHRVIAEWRNAGPGPIPDRAGGRITKQSSGRVPTC